MLSQEYESEVAYQQDSYPRNYKATDIFNLQPDANATGKRRVFDRNRSSVFDADAPSPTVTPRKDRMASDIFFGGNSPAAARFGGYEPSTGNSRRSSAKDQTNYAEAATVTERDILNYGGIIFIIN